jgi:hypothetical protein
VDHLASAWFRTLSACRLSLGVHWIGLLPGWPTHRRWWVIVHRFGLTVWYVCWETQTVTYHIKGCTLDVQAHRKASTKVFNLSKDKICFNLSLSISIWVSITIRSQLLSAPDHEHSSSLGRTPARWVWANKVRWHRSSVQVVGSRTGEFLDPYYTALGEDFGGPTRRSQEPRGVRL